MLKNRYDPNLDIRTKRKKLITKARKDENTKKDDLNFVLSPPPDDFVMNSPQEDKEITIGTLTLSWIASDLIKIGCYCN